MDMIALSKCLPTKEPKGGHSSFPFPWHTATAQWWDDLGLFPAHPEVPPLHHIPDITLPTLHQMRGLSWYRGLAAPPPPPSLPPNALSAPLPDPPAYATPFPSLLTDRPAAPIPLNFVDRLGYTGNGDALSSAVQGGLGMGGENLGRGGIKFHNFSMLCLTKKLWNSKGPIPPYPALPIQSV